MGYAIPWTPIKADMAILDQRQLTWDSLAEELDAWVASGTEATLWWRDDDATDSGSKLDRLLELTTETGILLASMPALATTRLADRVAATDHAYIGQHGFSHTNYAPKGQGQGAWELGLHRSSSVVLDELLEGRHRSETLFGDRFIPVLIPPWNRIDDALLMPIAENGFRGLSRFGPRQTSHLTSDCVVINAHCDPIKWKSGPRFTGEAKALDQFISHLRSRRAGDVDPAEPTGILTHHIDLDEPAWAFCEQLVNTISSHPGACWCSIPELFPETE